MRRSDKEALERIMTNLGLTEKEALEVLDYDKRVCRNEKTEYDLTEEQQKVAKAMCQGDWKKSLTGSKKVGMKPNAEKELIVAILVKELEKIATIQVTNPANKFLITKDKEIFEVTLSQTKAITEIKGYRPDEQKEKLITAMRSILETQDAFAVEELIVANPTRQIDFISGGNKFRIAMIKKTK